MSYLNIKDLFTEKFLADIQVMIAEGKKEQDNNQKQKPTDKTEVDLNPKVNGPNSDDDEDDQDEVVDTDDKVAPKKPKKPSKTPVSEKYDVAFSDAEIAHFDKIINKEGK